MDMIAVEGAELSTLALGHPIRAPLVMVHGFITGNSASWYSTFAKPLSGKRHVLLYDLRGHGASTVAHRGFDLDTQAQDLAAVLQHHACRHRPIELVGHSMGALIALRFALRHPQQVRRLVLVDPPMPASERVAPSLRRLGSPEMLASYIGGLREGGGIRRRARFQRRLEALLFESTLIDDVSVMQGETEAALAALDLPVLLAYGRYSPFLADGMQLQHLLPQARLELFECGHDVHIDCHEALLACIEDFISVAAAGERGYEPSVVLA